MKWYLIYTENCAHCFTCRGKLLSEFLAFLAGMATWVEFNPQRVVVAQFDRELEGNPYHLARFFSETGYHLPTKRGRNRE